jgi:predicted DCC family thiol-disulfide oxidoreductase YuxK
VPGSRRVGSPPDRPLIVFDGDCGFCRFWIARWQRRQTVDYQPFQDQDIEQRFADIPRERFARAVHLIETDGGVSEGAEAQRQ